MAVTSLSRFFFVLVNGTGTGIHLFVEADHLHANSLLDPVDEHMWGIPASAPIYRYILLLGFSIRRTTKSCIHKSVTISSNLASLFTGLILCQELLLAWQ